MSLLYTPEIAHRPFDMESFRRERRENIPVYEPISKEEIEFLKSDIEQNIGADISQLPIKTSRPGEYFFDLFEARLKLYHQFNDHKSFIAFMEGRGYDFSKFNPDDDRRMVEAAIDRGIQLDGSMKGFAYNISGYRILYFAVRENDILSKANEYAAKEHDGIEFSDKIEAEEYLHMLAVKYFYHEVGHSMYIQMINNKLKANWISFVRNNPQLQAAVREVQKDKHPKLDAQLIANEAFAEIFTDIGSRGRFSNRLGNHPEATEFATMILRAEGFDI